MLDVIAEIQAWGARMASANLNIADAVYLVSPAQWESLCQRRHGGSHNGGEITVPSHVGPVRVMPAETVEDVDTFHVTMSVFAYRKEPRCQR